MAIYARCPKCDAAYHIVENALGKEVACRSCGHRWVLAHAAAQPSVSSPEPPSLAADKPPVSGFEAAAAHRLSALESLAQTAGAGRQANAADTLANLAQQSPRPDWLPKKPVMVTKTPFQSRHVGYAAIVLVVVGGFWMIAFYMGILYMALPVFLALSCAVALLVKAPRQSASKLGAVGFGLIATLHIIAHIARLCNWFSPETLPVFLKVFDAATAVLSVACGAAVVISLRSRPAIVYSCVGAALMCIGVSSRLLAPNTIITHNEVEQYLCNMLFAFGWGDPGLVCFLAAILSAWRRDEAVGSPNEARARSLTCRHCGRLVSRASVRCAECRRRLRPVFLGFFTLAGPVVLFLLTPKLLEQYRDTYSVYMLSIGWYAAGALILMGLRYGHFWAWVGIQIVWGIAVVLAAVSAVGLRAYKGEVALAFLVPILIQVLVTIYLWTYIYRPRVRDFCSYGSRFLAASLPVPSRPA